MFCWHNPQLTNEVTRWFPQKCSLQKNDEISKIEIIKTKLQSAELSADETPEMSDNEKSNTDMSTAEASAT